MSVQSEIDRIITAVGNAYSKVSQKGGTVPASQTVANLATAIDSIPAGGGGTPSLQSKSVTYTANGTATITPDAGYDGLSSVEVTVDVAGSGIAPVSVATFDYDFGAFKFQDLSLIPDGAYLITVVNENNPLASDFMRITKQGSRLDIDGCIMGFLTQVSIDLQNLIISYDSYGAAAPPDMKCALFRASDFYNII